jgi:hypothetical protein
MFPSTPHPTAGFREIRASVQRLLDAGDALLQGRDFTSAVSRVQEAARLIEPLAGSSRAAEDLREEVALVALRFEAREVVWRRSAEARAARYPARVRTSA